MKRHRYTHTHTTHTYTRARDNPGQSQSSLHRVTRRHWGRDGGTAVAVRVSRDARSWQSDFVASGRVTSFAFSLAFKSPYIHIYIYIFRIRSRSVYYATRANTCSDKNREFKFTSLQVHFGRKKKVVSTGRFVRSVL